MDEDSKLFREVMTETLPLIRHRTGALFEDIADESLLEVWDYLFSETEQRYSLSHRTVLLFLLRLLTPSATDVDWQLGIPLARVYLPTLERMLAAPGRPSGAYQRTMAFCYLEWRLGVKEGSNGEAIARAAALFDMPEDRIQRWFLAGKGDYAREREYARWLVNFAHSHLTDIPDLDPR